MIRMLVVKLYFVLLNCIFLKTLVGALSCCRISLLDDVSFINCGMFLKGLGKHLLFTLDQIFSSLCFWLFLTWLTLWFILPYCNYSKLKLFKISSKNLIMDSWQSIWPYYYLKKLKTSICFRRSLLSGLNNII